jgi:hypothetical protein
VGGIIERRFCFFSRREENMRSLKYARECKLFCPLALKRNLPSSNEA